MTTDQPHTDAHRPSIRRRSFLGQAGLSTSIALNLLASEEAGAAHRSIGSGRPLTSLAPQAKSIIQFHMVGAPSQLDLFDFKPTLQEYHGRQCPADLLEGQRFAFLPENPKLLGTQYRFRRHGQCGHELSELLPRLASVADEIAIVRSMHTEEFNHGPAQVYWMTGFARQGRPSVGSWLSYGLGSESRNLPAFVVLVTGLTAGGGSSLWGSGFLPTSHQGVRFRNSGEPVLFVDNPEGIDHEARGRIVDDISKLNAIEFARMQDPEIQTRIRSYELAYRMQTSLPDLTEISQEPKHVLDEYGVDGDKTPFARNCLLARRLVERGVRVVQIYDQGWDHHSNLTTGLPAKCRVTDQPVAALVKDLRQRGLLDETLVVWGAEFGRTPMLQGELDQRAGRDHHKDAFTIWMAGGGIQRGAAVGKTDDLGYHISETPVHVNDLHATILHQMGIDHEELTYRYQGRPFRLTDVGGRVIDELI